MESSADTAAAAAAATTESVRTSTPTKAAANDGQVASMASTTAGSVTPAAANVEGKLRYASSRQQRRQEHQEAHGTHHPEQQENQYFYEDEVFYIDGKGHVRFGLVLENFEDTEDEPREEVVLKRGEIRACWHPDGREEIVKETKVGLADRTLMPGDVVRRMIPGEDTQRGYCHEIFVSADVRVIGTKHVVQNVTSDRLRPLMSMPKDNAVCLDSWVGSTKMINEKLVLKSACGSLVEITPNSEFSLLKDTDTRSRSGFFGTTLFYPGQTLIVPMTELENAKWLTTSPEMKLNRRHGLAERKFTVQSVDIDGVCVHWQCKASSEDIDYFLGKDGFQQPPEYITGANLLRMQKLNLFESCMLQINDKNYMQLMPSDSTCRQSLWQKKMDAKYRKLQMESEALNATDDEVWVDGKKKITVTKTNDNDTVQHDVKPDLEKEKLSAECGGTRATKGSCQLAESDEWETDDGHSNDERIVHSDGGTSSCSTTPKTSPKKSLAKRVRKIKRKPAKTIAFDQLPSYGLEVLTEALVVHSTATVVWQDGTIERDIPSMELCPIHHLDDHEFFPGDFVLTSDTDHTLNAAFRDYGVIQNVDHHGRTAMVKWFSTYTCIDEPEPTYNGETEVSVYDLKDHPDFQYRPGTIVIRVANFDDSQCPATAGQVIDNYPTGMVKVWWSDQCVSMCWPQDIYEVGQYDSENTFWSHNVSDNSWETEDETSEYGGMSSNPAMKPKLTANLERARVAMARLEELFNLNPHLQNQDIMKKLLLVYKKCRYLDRLMDTSFFHEDHFMGLVERVRKSNNQTTAERVLDQKNRLFNHGSVTTTPTTETPVSSSKFPCSSSSSGAGSARKCLIAASSSGTHNLSTSSDISSIEDNQRVAVATTIAPPIADSATQENDVANGNEMLNELDNVNNVYMNINEELNNTTSVFSFSSPQVDDDMSSSCASAKLCSLIKAQLVKALAEINERFNLGDQFKEIVTIVEPKTPIFEGNPFGYDPSPEDSPYTSEHHDLAANLEPVPSEESIKQQQQQPEEEQHPIGNQDCFQILETTPSSHKFHLTLFQFNNAQSFYNAVHREHKLLRTALPAGVWVKTFEDRMDLLSVMIEGPKKTPYEDGLFLFDIQLGQDYPRGPPLCHYISYCTDRLNPNLYEDGKVCVSLLGTWSGRGTEMWGPTSTLLQVIVSIQGLILVDEPYFNEAGYEKQRGSQQGNENSRMYNEMVLLKLVQSMTKLMSNPPETFRSQILAHFRACGQRMYRRIKAWMDLSNEVNQHYQPTPNGQELETESAESMTSPEFPLIPASRGFCLTLVGLLEKFCKQLEQLGE